MTYTQQSLKQGAKGSRRKKCQECIDKLDDLINRLDSRAFKGYFEDSAEDAKVKRTEEEVKEESDDDMEFDLP